ncbi:MAG: hypothetical protein ACKOSQ_11045 [Planctomycetaceae bacterium]
MTPGTATPPPPNAEPLADAAGTATVQSIAFVNRADDSRPAIVQFPDSASRAVFVGLRPAVTAGDATAPAADLTLLVVPARAADAEGLAPEELAWVEAAGPVQAIAVHGAALAWAAGRAAIRVEPARLDAVRAAVVEFCFHERELRAIEAEVAAGWPEVEADAPLAFEFRDRDADRRRALGERFRRTVSLRARLARLAPHLDRPPLHPPTLASQVGERLRERSRMAERAGFLTGQIEVQERVYDLCGQRSSDWALSRKSTTLEWAIVVLIAIETVLILVDLLATRGT